MAGSAGSPSVWRRKREVWVCCVCGPHPDSHRNWCGAGCGRDYNEMVEYVPREQSDPVADRLAQLLVWVRESGLPEADTHSVVTAGHSTLAAYREATAGEDGDG